MIYIYIYKQIKKINFRDKPSVIYFLNLYLKIVHWGLCNNNNKSDIEKIGERISNSFLND